VSAPAWEEVALLREVALFANLPDAALRELAALARPVAVPAGEVLFERGDVGDALYVVRAGRLEALIDGAVVREAGRGEVLGELALLTGGLRTATVRARRDAELYAVHRADLDMLLRDPASARALVRHLAARIPGGAPPAPARAAAVLALVPGDRRTSPALLRRLADRLAGELSRHADLTRLDADAHPAGWPARLDAAESGPGQVLLVAEYPDDAWARFCLRQADRPLVVVDGADAATSPRRPLPAATQLVVVGEAGPTPWLRALTPATHHLVGAGLPPEDVARLARRLGGRAVGLVLSGGGARGLAHVGVVDELRRAGIVIDRVGGTSMGAVVAGLFAMGADPAAMIDVARRELVERRPFGDLTWPRHALVRGSRLAATLRRVYGNARVEDQRTALFTVSVDLVAAEKVVHRSGPIADAVALSVRLPGITPPQRVGAQLHVDGGVLDNLPIRVMAAEGEGPVLAVDVAQPFSAGALAALPRIVDTIGRAMTIASWRSDDPGRALAREVIVPDLGDIGLFDFRRIDDLVERGRAAGRAAAARLRDLATAP
jgi:NTE family protein